MNTNPYQSPEGARGSQPVLDESKIRKDLEKVIKARKYMFIAIPLVGTMTFLQYAKFFSPGNLPNWFGLLVVAICLVQLPFLTQKIARLESMLVKN